MKCGEFATSVDMVNNQAVWCVQTGVFGNDFDRRMQQALIECDVEYHTYDNHYGFIESKNSCDDFDGVEDKMVVHGSLNFCNYVARNITSNVFYAPKVYDCLSYYSDFHEYLLNDLYVLTPFIDLKRNIYYLRRTFTNNIFLRPNSGFKTFTGQAVNWQELDKFQSLNDIDDDELVLVAPAVPTETGSEWRIVVCNDEIVASSQYLKDDEVVEECGSPEHVIDFAREVLKNTSYRPFDVWTLDVCDYQGDPAVVEINSFSAASLYQCDLHNVVRAVSDYISLHKTEE